MDRRPRGCVPVRTRPLHRRSGPAERRAATRLITDEHAPDVPDAPIATDEGFGTALRQLLRAASENGVDPEGAWVCRTDEKAADWEVVIVPLEEAPTD